MNLGFVHSDGLGYAPLPDESPHGLTDVLILLLSADIAVCRIVKYSERERSSQDLFKCSSLSISIHLQSFRRLLDVNIEFSSEVARLGYRFSSQPAKVMSSSLVGVSSSVFRFHKPCHFLTSARCCCSTARRIRSAMAQPQRSTAPRTEGGEGEGSYSHQSKLWRRMGSILEPSLKDAILHHLLSPQLDDGPIHYADFGCSVGANTLGFAKFVVDALKSRPEIGERDIVCHFADLPSNDFNTLFKQLPPMVGQGDGGEEERTWFADGVPGTQYGRMFPRSSLHVAITALTLHYLNEVPKSILEKSSPTYNKGKVGPNGASPAVAEAYAEASREGLRKFFECRAEEIASGGVLCFYCAGRKDRAHPENQLFEESIHFSPYLEKAWLELVNEGVMAGELLDTFNVPICQPSVEELRQAIEHEPSAFQILKLDFIEKYSLTPDNAGRTVFKDAESYATVIANMCKSGMGPMLGDQLGAEQTEALMDRFRQICVKDYPTKKAAGFPMYMSMCVAALVRK